jgi:hypothetical protein
VDLAQGWTLVSLLKGILTALRGPSQVAKVSGKLTAPAAGAVICDTGQLAAGTYTFRIQAGASDTVAVAKGVLIEHRNAANSATLWQVLVPVLAFEAFDIRFPVATNERVRAIANIAGAASSQYGAAIQVLT